MSYKIKEKNFVSIIVHVKEHGSNLEQFIKSVNTVFQNNFESFEYIVVNNNPNKVSSDLLSNVFLNDINQVIKVVNLSWFHNIEDAMRSGIELAIGDFIFEFDSVFIDFPLDHILQVYYKSLEGYDAVAAEPKSKNSLKSKPFYNILNKLSNRNVNLTTETFRVVSRRMLNRSSSKESFRYRKINYHYSGLKTTVLQYPVDKKNKKEVDFKTGDKVSLAGNILIYYSNIGTKISLWLSLLFFLVSLFVIGFTIFSYITKIQTIQKGWTTMMLFSSISFTGLFAILAVVSKYMEVLLREAQISKPYSFKSIDRVS